MQLMEVLYLKQEEEKNKEYIYTYIKDQNRPFQALLKLKSHLDPYLSISSLLVMDKNDFLSKSIWSANYLAYDAFQDKYPTTVH